MREHIELAVQNVIKHGDTDIFPSPFENHAFFDRRKELMDLVQQYHNNFENCLNQYPPQNINSLTPIGYSGFRWATQLDPLWNIYFLACVLTCSSSIESARLPKDKNIIYSYRYAPDIKSGDLFDRNYFWPRFIDRSIKLSNDYGYVVSCDVAEFYARLDHHRLENALQQLNLDSDMPHRIIRFLSNFSNTRSFGIPIGGPAARILSELSLNQIDRLLHNQNIPFVRFADDFHLYANSMEEAYRHLIFLSEKLIVNQGLLLQKSKTRIMTAQEFRSTNPLNFEDGSRRKEHAAAGRALLQISLRFDPYSATAEEDYEKLKTELEQIDILALLNEEIAKSRVHAALSKKIVAAVRFLDSEIRDGAVLSLMENAEKLYPVFSSILMMVYQTFDKLSAAVQSQVKIALRSLIEGQSHIMRVEVHLDLAVRILALRGDAEDQIFLEAMFQEAESPMLRRDLILAVGRCGDWYWLSDKRNRFREMSGPERRAFLVASFYLRDEGRHWRQHIRDELSPFEMFIKEWAAERAGVQGWSAPL